MKYIREAILSILATSVIACGGNQNMYSQANNTKMNTVQTPAARVMVQKYADETANYLKKNSEKKLIELVKAEIKDSLKDPSSAQFKDVRVVKVKEGKLVCGQVNGKNSYGGYGGFKYFLASPSRHQLETSDNWQVLDDIQYACLQK